MRPSIRRRILTLSAATTLLAVGGNGLLVWLLMSRALRTAFDEALRAEAAAVAARVERDHGRLEFDWHEPPRPSAADDDAPPIRVFTDDGREVYSSPELTALPRPAGALRGAVVGSAVWFDAPLGANGRPHRLVALCVLPIADDEVDSTDIDPEPPRVWVLLARPLAPLTASLRQLAATLIIAAGVGGAAALLLGLLVSRAGTRPIRELARRVQAVRADRPELAIDPSSAPVELAPMVDTIGELLGRIRVELDRRRQLTADVAHDLRTPVAGVRALLDVSLQRPRDAAEYVDTMMTARAALRQLSVLLENVLTLARLDAGVDAPQREPVAIAEVVAGAVAAVQPMADARRVRIRMAVESTLRARSDRTRLHVILTNLLGNAVEYGPPDEEVSVAADARPDALRLVIADRGPGISPAQRERLFDRFARADASRTADGHHGLGLPIARGLARLLGGDVWFDDAAAGTCVVVQLPLDPPSEPAQRSR